MLNFPQRQSAKIRNATTVMTVEIIAGSCDVDFKKSSKAFAGFVKKSFNAVPKAFAPCEKASFLGATEGPTGAHCPVGAPHTGQNAAFACKGFPQCCQVGCTVTGCGATGSFFNTTGSGAFGATGSNFTPHIPQNPESSGYSCLQTGQYFI